MAGSMAHRFRQIKNDCVLAPSKLKTFIDLKYQGIRDMPEELGKAAGVKQLFSEFQRRLYA